MPPAAPRFKAGRPIVIVAVLVGMAASNLSPILGNAWGTPFALLGLRQAWTMFAPSAVHDAPFVSAETIDPEGHFDLHIDAEPPAEGWFFRLGYDRIHKLHKNVALEPKRYAAPYAEALCRVHDLHGEVELSLIRHATPSPPDRLLGHTTIRTVTPIGRWPCP